MRIVHLHDINNSQQVIPFDADDFSAAVPFGSGSAVRTKSSDQPVFVHECTTEVEEVING